MDCPLKGAWDRAETTAFLESTTVPIRLACTTPKGALWMVSLWYRHEEGALKCATAASADVVEFLEADDGVAWEVSTNDPPYMGVRGNGTASLEPDADKAVLKSLLDRYVGGPDNSLGEFLLREDREERVITIDPRRAYTWDYSDRMADL